MIKQPSMKIDVVSESLADLLEIAKEQIYRIGQQHATQRGKTSSMNNVALTWLAPQKRDEGSLRWSSSDVEWYLENFVKSPSTHHLLFPYTYYDRSHCWDGGWAHFVSILQAMRAGDVDLVAAAGSLASFTALVATLGERVHVQTVLSLLALYPLPLLRIYLDHPDLAHSQAQTWRTDMLHAAISDIGANPHSRRAVVGPLLYPHLERQLQPQMSKPPYQLFQFLPGDRDAPLSSIHEHRSLDVVGGAQLDFAHDLLWLSEACNQLGRPMGNITVIAHNLHSYHDPDGALANESIEAWLCRVTDGYHAGQGIPRRLLQQPEYAANVARIYQQWRAE